MAGSEAPAPSGILSVRGKGAALAAPRQAPEPVYDPDRSAMMARMLAAVVSRGSGRAAGDCGTHGRGKTGTTQDYRDAWFVGWTNGMVIGVWLGNDDNRPTKGVIGGTLPRRGCFGRLRWGLGRGGEGT